MKKLAGKTPAKVIAFLLAVVCAVGCVGGLYLTAKIAVAGGYRYTKDAYVSRELQQYLEDDVSSVEGYYALLLNGQKWTEEQIQLYELSYAADNTNFRFTVLDYDTNEVLLSNTDTVEEYRCSHRTETWLRPADFEEYYDYENYLRDHYYNTWLKTAEQVQAVEEEGLETAATEDGFIVLDYDSIYAAAIPEQLEPEDGSARHVVVTGMVVSDLSRVDDQYSQAYERTQLLYSLRLISVWVAVICGVCFVALFLFLMYASGRRSGSEEIVLRQIDRVSWDLLLVVCTGLGWLLAIVCIDAVDWLRFRGGIFHVALLVAGATALAALVLGFAVTLAARIKTEGWLKNSLCYRLAVWLGRCLKGPMKQLREVIHNLPLLWKTVAFGVGVVAVEYVCVQTLYYTGFWLPLVIWNLAVGVIVLMASLAMRKLQDACGRIADGELDYRLDTGTMQGDFRRHGEDLNRIGSGLSKAVEERLRSERLKTELITNVSHDLKTPLTSIVNYADLLGKVEGLPPEAVQYVEVLQRQSARLKKLTEDLVEASKASTGSLPVTITDVNLCELLLQVEGEYEERFTQAGLAPVLQLPEPPLYARGDGRYLWRILDNLMSNVRKYALAGTRVYIQAGEQEGGVIFSVKNISRDQLTISAEGLTERFVRGDSSRNTEGSGLGLSIAISLAQLMGGRLTVTVDGDLFKAEVWLKKAQTGPEE